ncbi:MAG: histidine kinase dimerization/phosphoacceptor domain -containing protein, partial [Pacificimonas sp.]
MTSSPLEAFNTAPPALDQLLLREAVHRFGNDLQMIVGLIAIEGLRSANPDVKEALQTVGDRIAVFARARRGFQMDGKQSLSQALH